MFSSELVNARIFPSDRNDVRQAEAILLSCLAHAQLSNLPRKSSKAVFWLCHSDNCREQGLSPPISL